MRKNNNRHSFILRLSVVFILHLLFKQGDKTFTGVFEPTLRSLFLSLFFIAYWMAFWEICHRINTRFSSKDKERPKRNLRLVTLSSLYVILDILFVSIFNWLYLLADYHLFGNVWKDIHFINPEFFDPSGIFDPIGINPEMIMGLTLMFILVYGIHLFITYVREVKELELTAEQQKRENIQAKYTALKNQIDPHFFFNSLSVLSSLVYEDTELSASYISHLSKHYRYVLEINSEDMVSVNRELECLDSYFFLIKMRYPDSIRLSVNLSENTRQNCRVASHSLQMLIENAVKHNNFSRQQPLMAEICENDDYIIVSNNSDRKKQHQETTGVGLMNIRNRYAIETTMEIKINESDNMFSVYLPKIFRSK